MAIELLRDHDLDGVTQHCIKVDCSCGAERIISFQKIKNRDRTQCEQCGCVRSFHISLIEKIESEIVNGPSDQ
jgi:hypothetical protein